MREAIGNLVVGVYADRVGRGPTKVRTVVDGDVVVCLLEDTMTRAEHSLLADGRESAVMTMRSNFQETMRAELIDGIEALTGRTVAAFMSGSSLEPDLASELFVLDGRRGKSKRSPTRIAAPPLPLGEPALPPDPEPDLV